MALEAASTVTIQETMQDFLVDYQARDAAPATVYRYRHFISDYSVWLEREGQPTDMATLQGRNGYRLVQGYYVYLRNERKSAPGTVATAHRVIKTFFNWCARESLDEHDEPVNPPFVRKAPTDYFDKLAVPKDIVADDVGEPYRPEEVKRLLEAIGPAKQPRPRDPAQSGDSPHAARLGIAAQGTFLAACCRLQPG